MATASSLVRNSSWIFSGGERILRNLLPPGASRTGRFVWLGNLEAERFWTRPSVLRLPSFSRASDAAIVNRLEEMALFLVEEPDLLILRSASDPYFLDYVAGLGLRPPSILTCDAQDGALPISQAVLQDARLCATVREMALREDLYLLPYAVTGLEEEIAAATGLGWVGPSAAVCERVNSKIYGRRISRELGLRTIPGGECESLEALEDVYRALSAGGNGPFVVKESMGVSGRGLAVIDAPNKLQNLVALLKRRQKPDSRIEFVLERWIDKVKDINYLIFVDPSGEIVPLGVKEAVTDKGVHRGHRWPAALTPDQRECYQQAALAIGRRLYQDGFTGIAGIDSVIDRAGTVYPVLEVNARFNMSTYELRLNEIVGTGALMEVKLYPLSLRRPLQFQQLISALGDDLFRAGRSGGIGVFCFATANCNFQPGAALPVKGRIYSFLAGEDEAEIERLDAKMAQALAVCGAGLNA